MRNGLILLMIVLMCGCASVEYETVNDTLSVCDPADAPFEICVDLPPETVPVRSSGQTQVFAAPRGDYEITTRVLVTDGLDAAVYAMAGSPRPQLRCARGQQEECQFVWCGDAEEGRFLCRALCRRDGDFCYCLCLRMKEGLGARYNEMINDLFASFVLVPKESGGIPPAHSQARPDNAPHTSRCRH